MRQTRNPYLHENVILGRIVAPTEQYHQPGRWHPSGDCEAAAETATRRVGTQGTV